MLHVLGSSLSHCFDAVTCRTLVPATCLGFSHQFVFIVVSALSLLVAMSNHFSDLQSCRAAMHTHSLDSIVRRIATYGVCLSESTGRSSL